MGLPEIAIFVLATAGITWFSWPWLFDPRAHGFWRYFAFEAITALVLLNVRVWFDDPFRPAQLASWALLLGSIPFLAGALWLLRRVGKPQGSFENTTVLVREGLYRWIRHPMYSSLLLLAWGAWLKDVSFAGTALVLVSTSALFATARAEERENLARFGAPYADFMNQTRRFIPFVV